MTGGTTGGDQGFTLGGDVGASTGSYRDVRDRVRFDVSVQDGQTVEYDVTGLGD